ncbi:MAG TPA: DUF969 domain-containing protein [Phenylobacterium sp.]|uniref:DUF969 domain-containing protein n=1 Tax=Phenylobacterium sp. TaxID=1871053 RepID=UPI002CBE240E|nr:DUF969 domain-containing protein [Phenylobacterium sp.]HSV04601.1 DUF969 domain-containing protein [Phenylobacterium sp.]
MLTLLGVAVVVLGFAAGFNPLLVVVAAALVTGWTAGIPPLQVLAALGKAFNDNRFVSAALLVLPVIGVAERAGLQERARMLIGRFRRLSFAPLLIGYMVFRQVTAAIGLTSIAGQAQSIRPMVAPMAEAAAEKDAGALDPEARERIRAWAAATDNIALFFSEDVFIAVGSILLMVGFLAQSGLNLDPLQLSVWAIPTALAALLIHGTRLVLLQRRLKRRGGAGG